MIWLVLHSPRSIFHFSYDQRQLIYILRILSTSIALCSIIFLQCVCISARRRKSGRIENCSPNFFLFLLLRIHIMDCALVLLHIIVLSEGRPTKAHTRFQLLMNAREVLFRMRFLLKSFVAIRIWTFERPRLSMYHRYVSRQTIVKSKLTVTFRAFERPRFFV